MCAGRDEPGDVSDVGDEVGVDLRCDLREALEIEGAGVGRVTDPNQLGALGLGEISDLIEIDAVVRELQKIVNRVTRAVELVLVLVLASGALVLFASVRASMDERIRRVR